MERRVRSGWLYDSGIAAKAMSEMQLEEHREERRWVARLDGTKSTRRATSTEARITKEYVSLLSSASPWRHLVLVREISPPRPCGRFGATVLREKIKCDQVETQSFDFIILSRGLWNSS
jgi:hypothetical protein